MIIEPSHRGSLIPAFAAAGFICATLLGACGDPSDPSEPSEAIDEETASFHFGGKADGLSDDCTISAVLSLVNDPDHDASTLKSKGVHSRAASHIAAYRAGGDGVPATADDEFINDLRELDGIKWVGPVALSQLIDAVHGQCPGTKVEVEVIFSPQPRPHSHLAHVAELIDQAESSVDIAIYSFRDAEIQAGLARAVERGVVVRVLFETAHEDSRDPVGSKSAKLEELGMDVRYVNKIMHHKFAIIDGPRDDLISARTGWLVTGSANFSTSAGTRYDENTVFLRGSTELLLEFQREFNHLWDNSRDFSAGVEFEFPAAIAVGGNGLDEAGVEAVFTSANFEVRHTSRGATLTRVRGQQEVADRVVKLIESAQTSIWIASGHMRSRPIAQALIAKIESKPDIDVRVYLDAQEYISRSKQESLRLKLADCLLEATSERARQDCLESGHYFSRDLHDAGANVKMKWYSYRWHYSYAVQMHHKYLIIDGHTVASGSYNLSSNAEFNSIENMVIYSGGTYSDLVSAFEANFSDIWRTGDAQVRFDALMEEIENGTGGTIPIVFEPMALTHAQISAYRTATAEHCADVNSESFRRRPERHHTCTRKQ